VPKSVKGSNATIMVVVKGQLFRDGIQSVLQSPDRVIIGDYETIDQVVSKLETIQPPDLFVVGGGGAQEMLELFANIRKLRPRMPKAKWLVLSPRTDPHLLREALEAGADGLLLEDSPGEVLQLLTRLVLLGYPFVPASFARILGGRPTSGEVPESPSDETPTQRVADSVIISNGTVAEEHRADLLVRPRTGLVPEQIIPNGGTDGRRQTELSDRENEILGCLVSGHSNKTIARKLDIAEATVKVHVKGLLRKMQVSNRTQAAVRALKFPPTAMMSGNPIDEMMK
jgi:two-component system nitrate/nitrite response regulator NarL